MSTEGAMEWLVCVAEGDREGLTINEHTAKMAADVRIEIERLRAINAELVDLLEWLDRLGGLGYDKHDRIRAAITKAKEKP